MIKDINTVVMNPCIDPVIALMIKQSKVTLFDVAQARANPTDPVLVQKAEDILELERLVELQYAETQAIFEDGLTAQDTPPEELNDGTPEAERILAAAGYVSSEADPKRFKKQCIMHKRYDPKQKRWFVDTEERFVDLTPLSDTEH